MAFLLSTGAKKMLLDSGFVTPMTDCAIIFYNGNPPTAADDALPAGNTRIAIGAIGSGWTAGSGTGVGIPWDASDANGDVIVTSPITDVKCYVEVTGTIRWGWMINDAVGADGTGASTTLIRLQGNAGVSSGEFKLSNTSVIAGQNLTLDVAAIRFPAG